MNSRKLEEYVKRMKRRRDFLDRLEDDHPAKSELAVTEWLITYIEDDVITAGDHLSKYMKEKQSSRKK